jgi:hypothetical protein
MPTTSSRRLLLETLAGDDAFARVEPALAVIYGDLVGELWRALLATQAPAYLDATAAAQPPRIEVVHSILSRPMSSRDGGQWFLTYDQHLGQVLSRLTKLVLSEASPAAADAYLQKLFAQRLYVAGQFTASVAMLMRSQQRKPPVLESPEQAEARGQAVLAQEAFVIAHELTHVLLRKVDVREELADEVFSILDDVSRADRPGPEEFEAQWNQSFRDLATRYGFPDAEIPPIDHDRLDDSVSDRVTSALRERPDLLEECLCDYAGSIAAALSAVSFRQASVEESFVASAMALHHLRLLQLLDNYANRESPARVFADSMIRLSVHRRLVAAFAASVGETWDAQPVEVHKRTVAYNLAFSRVLGDPAMFVLGFDSYLDEVEPASNAASQSWDRKQRLWLREQLGFDPQAKPVSR